MKGQRLAAPTVASARTIAVRLGLRSRTVVTMASFVGLVAFLWPFVVAPGAVGDATTAPLMFAALLVLVVAVVLSEIADGGIDAKAVAMLGVLSAVGAALRPLGAGTAGIETVFFTLVIAGRVFGAGFGFVLGCTTLFASALITGGIGPWMPYQMFGSAWVGLLAGLLPPARGRRELVMLAVYGATAGYLYGFLVNLSSWPFVIDPHSTIAYVPGAALLTNVRRYLVYYGTTSLGWDTGRAVTNVVCILLAGPAMLATFRRAARRAAFEAPVAFTERADGADSHAPCPGRGIGASPVADADADADVDVDVDVDVDADVDVDVDVDVDTGADVAAGAPAGAPAGVSGSGAASTGLHRLRRHPVRARWAVPGGWPRRRASAH